jgi:hypothetical protein
MYDSPRFNSFHLPILFSITLLRNVSHEKRIKWSHPKRRIFCDLYTLKKKKKYNELRACVIIIIELFGRKVQSACFGKEEKINTVTRI